MDSIRQKRTINKAMLLMDGSLLFNSAQISDRFTEQIENGFNFSNPNTTRLLRAPSIHILSTSTPRLSQ